MGLFSKAEKSIYFGKVIRDFGILDEHKKGFTKFKVSVLFCEKDGKKCLVSKQTARALLSASVTYHYIYEENLPKLKQAVDEALGLVRD
jgi:hypothetical protein